MNDLGNKYDQINDFNQGVAIVKRNGKYGAIIVGGREIIHPIYDALTDFDSGYANATYNGEERKVNLSGQIQVKRGDELIFLPEEYDWGFDFVDNICVVVKNGKFGIIDINNNVLIEPSFTYFSGYKNEYALLGNSTLSIIDTHCNILYSNVKAINDSYFIATLPEKEHLYGLLDKELNVIISFDYEKITPLSNLYMLAQGEKKDYVIDYKGTVLFELGKEDDIKIKDLCFVVKNWLTTRVISLKGKELLFLGINDSFKDIKSENDFFAVVNIKKNNRDLRYIISNTGETFIPLDNYRNVCFDSNVLYYRSLGGALFRIDSKGNYQLLYTHWKNDQLTPEIVKEELVPLQGKQVPADYLNYRFDDFADDIMSVCDMEKGLYGLADKEGNIIILPKYGCFVQWTKNTYIVSMVAKGESMAVHRFGIIDNTEKIILSFKYAFLGILIPEKILAYSLDAKIIGTHLNTCVKNNKHQYGQSFTEGLLNSEFVVICEPKYSAIDRIESLDFFKVADPTGKLWGIIDFKGNEIIPLKYGDVSRIESLDFFKVADATGKLWGITDFEGNEIVSTKYNSVSQSDKPNSTFLVKGLYNNGFSQNYLNSKGQYVVYSANEKIVLVPSSNYDWCGNFSNNDTAEVRQNGLKGKINTSGKLVALNDGKPLIVPSNYTWAYDFVDGYALVCQNQKWGVADINFNIVIPCEYSSLELYISGYYKYKTIDQTLFGIIDINNSVIAEAKYRSISCIENKYFMLSESYSFSSSTYVVHPLIEIVNMKGKKVLPYPCSEITHEILDSKDVWFATYNRKKGVCYDGQELIPFIYDSITIKEGRFICIFKYSDPEIIIEYNSNGEVITRYNNHEIIIPSIFSVALESCNGLFRVKRAEGWGIMNLRKELIVPTKYAYISDFVGTYAIIGDGDEISSLDEKHSYRDNMNYGLINTQGEVIIEPKYSDITLFKNGYIGFCECGKMGLMSANLSIIVPPSFERIWELGNQFFVVLNNEKQSGLISCNNEEIISFGEFDEIELFSTGLLKLIKHTYFDPIIKIINIQGNVLIGDDDSYDEITEVESGLMLVQKKEYYDYNDDSYYKVYNLFDVNGVRILPYFCKEIHFIENGYLSIKGDKGWGLADITGNIIIEPYYEEELKFENGTSNITVRGSSLIHSINLNGDVNIVNGNKNIKLPKEFYWGTEFVNGLSIVRSKKERDKVGIVNLKGKVVIPAVYDKISIMSNDCILVIDGICLGIADIKGRFMFPPIFSYFKYLTKDRIWVKWNVKVAMSWCNDGSFVTGDGEYSKSHDYPRQFDRVALCDSNGNILNDKDIVYISKFENGYAKAYKDIFVDERGVVRLTQAGIINMNGTIVLEPRYKRIEFHNRSYVLAKDTHYSIFRLSDKKLTCFKGNAISHIWTINCFGMAEYTSTGKYISKESSWDGDRGVLGIDGIIVPAGKYDYVELLNNGMILVANKPIVFSYEEYIPLSIGFDDDDDDYEIKTRKKQWYEEWGILLSNGKEIVPCCYSNIYYHSDDKIILCQGGDVSCNKYKGRIEVENGKWSVLDTYSHKVIETNTKEEAFEYEIKHKSTEIESINKESGSPVFENPKVLLTDHIEKRKNRVSHDYFQYDDDSDDGYSKYGGYNGWDDNTIDEAFDGNPELTWNID